MTALRTLPVGSIHHPIASRFTEMAIHGFEQLQVSPSPRTLATTDDLDAAATELGIRFPESYRAFVTQLGYGLLVGLFRVYLPKAKFACEDLLSAGRDLTEDIRYAVDQDWVRWEPDGKKELVLRLVPFGKSDNGDILAWDPQDESAPNEFSIYVLGARFAFVRRAADSLYEFVERSLRKNLDGMVGRIEAQLPSTFVPADITQ